MLDDVQSIHEFAVRHNIAAHLLLVVYTVVSGLTLAGLKLRVLLAVLEPEILVASAVAADSQLEAEVVLIVVQRAAFLSPQAVRPHKPNGITDGMDDHPKTCSRVRLLEERAAGQDRPDTLGVAPKSTCSWA